MILIFREEFNANELIVNQISAMQVSGADITGRVVPQLKEEFLKVN